MPSFPFTAFRSAWRTLDAAQRVLADARDTVADQVRQFGETVGGAAQGAVAVTSEYARSRLDAALDAASRAADLLGSPTYLADRMPKKITKKDVFIIHGHDADALRTLKTTLESWGLRPIILQNEASALMTIKQKIEKYAYSSSLGFAIALLTPDDDCSCSANPKPHKRARQNVVYELGFFVSAFRGRRTCILMKGTVETWSDIGGIGYTLMDEGGQWRDLLRKELRAAKMKMNRPPEQRMANITGPTLQ